jgi:hypothetical protein
MNANRIRILTVERDDDGLVVTFSDGTTAGYLVEELLDLRPQRLYTADFRELPPNPAS